LILQAYHNKSSICWNNHPWVCHFTLYSLKMSQIWLPTPLIAYSYYHLNWRIMSLWVITWYASGCYFVFYFTYLIFWILIWLSHHLSQAFAFNVSDNGTFAVYIYSRWFLKGDIVVALHFMLGVSRLFCLSWFHGL
jgi:hypothetical protein